MPGFDPVEHLDRALVDRGDRHHEPGPTRVATSSGTPMRATSAQHRSRIARHHTRRAVERLVDRLDRDPLPVRHREFVNDLLWAPPLVQMPAARAPATGYPNPADAALDAAAGSTSTRAL